VSGGPAEHDETANASIAGYMIFGDPRELPDIRDHRRHPKPGEPPVPDAQWNELSGQWERWDETAQGWVVVGEPGPGVDVYWDDDVAGEADVADC
jgi:hypothetical protein